MAFHYFFIAILVSHGLCLNNESMLERTAPIRWTPGLRPHLQNFKFSKNVQQEELDIFFSDAIILRKTEHQNQRQLWSVNFVVDKTNIAIAAHNLKNSLRTLHKRELKFSNEFFSCTDCDLEFFRTMDLTHHACHMTCVARKSQMFQNMADLGQYLEIFTPQSLNSFPDLWLDTNESSYEMTDKYYGTAYNITFQNGTHFDYLLPIPESLAKRVHCISFNQNEPVTGDCLDIGADFRYWATNHGKSEYYQKSTYNLLT